MMTEIPATYGTDTVGPEPSRYIVTDTATGKEYRVKVNHVQETYISIKNTLEWQTPFERNVPLPLARFLLTDYSTTAQDGFVRPFPPAAAQVMLRGAIACLLWVESDNPDARDDSALEQHSCTEETLAPDSHRALLAECVRFLQTCEQYGVYFGTANLDQVGHDFILTRNGHGTGFWDREEVYGRDYLFLTHMAGQYPVIDAQREGTNWSIDGLSQKEMS